MWLAVCPNCRVLHEVVDAAALAGADDVRRYALTHCRLCETSSQHFRRLEPEAPELRADELGYPAVVIQRAAGHKPGVGP
jgi:hypothetical protein